MLDSTSEGQGGNERAGDIDVDTTYPQSEVSDDSSAYTPSNTSLASNITRYRYENGRRYHAYRDGTYYAPNDTHYQAYELIVHHLWLLTLHDKLYLAPLDPATTKRILDLGTGTGLWAVDIADHFPDSEIIATDLSPILHTSALPPNFRFEIDDACAEWTWPEDYFSYIHIRGLTGCIKDWPATYAQAYTHLAPGGWIEHLEFSVETNADPSSPNPSDQIMSAFSSSFLLPDLEAKTGMSFNTIKTMKSQIQAAGFTDVTEQKFIWPIGAWPKDAHLKDLGRWGERNWIEGCEGWVMALYTRLLGWTYEEVKAFTGDLKRVVRDRRNRYWHEVRVVYARKPFEGEVVGTGGTGGTAETEQ